jgi:outer membrane protein assembly factor BamA
VVAASAEYRFPLLLVERGVSTLPFFFDRLWGDVFLDAGSAWCVRNCEERFAFAPRAFEPLASAGVETAFSALIGYDRHLTLRAGVAVPLVGIPTADESRERPRPSFYLVGGRGF